VSAPTSLVEVAGLYTEWLKAEGVPDENRRAAIAVAGALIRQLRKRTNSDDVDRLTAALVDEAFAAERVRLMCDAPGHDWPLRPRFVWYARELYRFAHPGVPTAELAPLPLLSLPDRPLPHRIAWDLDWRCRYIDRSGAEALAFQSPGQALGADAVLDLAPWWERSRRAAALFRTQERQETLLNQVYVLTQADWHTVVPSIWDQERPLYDDDGNLVGTLGYFRRAR
jgi:hypothetical protein